MNAVTTWIAVGFVGQAMFFGRFLVQWIAAERRGESIVPVSFWYLSIAGGLVLLAYAVHRGDPVFTAGQAFGAVVYVRNLMLIRRKKREEISAARSGQGRGLTGS